MHDVITDTAFWIAVVTAILGLASYLLRKYLEDRAINKAIEAEASRLLSVIEGQLRFLEKCKDISYHPLVPFYYAVYGKHVDNIGVISRKKIDAVVRFYGYVDFLNEYQKLRQHYEDTGHATEFFDRYKHQLAMVLHLFRNSFPPVKHTSEALPASTSEIFLDRDTRPAIAQPSADADR